MKFNKGFAADIRNAAWTSPRIAPINKADDADGICLFSVSILATSRLLPIDCELYVFSWPSKKTFPKA